MIKELLEDNFQKQLGWLEKYLIGHKGYIAGGCFKNIFKREKIKDIDMFFENKEEFEIGKKYFKDLIKEKPEEWDKAYASKNVYAIRDKKNKLTIELVKKTTGTPEDVISCFDFTITKFALYKDKENKLRIVYNEKFFEHLLTKKLVIDDDILYPLSTFLRSYKYRDYGYKLCSESNSKLVLEISQTDFDDGEIENIFNMQAFYVGVD